MREVIPHCPPTPPLTRFRKWRFHILTHCCVRNVILNYPFDNTILTYFSDFVLFFWQGASFEHLATKESQGNFHLLFHYVVQSFPHQPMMRYYDFC